jgi:hypothetical protein
MCKQDMNNLLSQVLLQYQVTCYLVEIKNQNKIKTKLQVDGVLQPLSVQ